MKGISLPINMIVIVAIAVLVLVVTAGYFGGAFVGSTGTIQFEQAFSSACTQLRNSYNCDKNEVGRVSVLYQAPGENAATTTYLSDLCRQKLGKGTVRGGGTVNSAECVKACGCPG